MAGEDQFWNEGVIGLVAGRIAEKYYRPTLIISRLIEAAEFDPAAKKLIPKKVGFKGSGRSVEEFNLIAAVEECAETLEKYGGHPMACGFSLDGEDNLAKFKEKLRDLAAARLAGVVLQPKLKIDRELKLGEINLGLAAKIGELAPFGQNNPQPRFVSYNLRLLDVVTMGFNNQHIKLRLASDEDGAGSFWALAFGAAEDYKDFQVGDRVDLVYYLEVNSFNGREEPQLKIIDLKISA